MREFTLLGFVSLLGTLRLEMEHANRTALERAGHMVRDEARRVLGSYDYGWPPLAPSTIARKVAGDTPGLETAQMRDSIQSRADHKTAEVGSDMDRAVYFDQGTSRQPPRPIFVPAFHARQQEVLDVIGRHIMGHLVRR